MNVSFIRSASATNQTGFSISAPTIQVDSNPGNFLVVGIGGTNTPSAVSFSGVPMTLVDSKGDGTGNVQFWVLPNPPITTSTIDITTGNATLAIGVVAGLYASVNQNTNIDSFADDKTSGGPSTFAVSIATISIAKNCWIIGLSGTEDDGAYPPVETTTATAGTTFREKQPSGGSNSPGIYLFDSNGAVSPGSNSLGYSINRGPTRFDIAASLAPNIGSGNMFLVM